MQPNNDVTWPDSVWQEINDGVLKEVGKVRVAQKVFATTTLDNHPNQTIPNEVIDFKDLSIKEGDTKPLAEIYSEFAMTGTQVEQEEEQMTCRTLARMAAKAIALGEDAYFFQLSDPDAAKRQGQGLQVKVPANVTIDNWRRSLDLGLLAEANPVDADDGDGSRVTKPIEVPLANGGNAKYGEETFTAVAEGISRLVAKAQAGPYALFLPTTVYADTFIPPSSASLVTTADRIKPLVEGGYYTCGVLPDNEGLLVALAGEPAKLCVGREASTEFVRKQGAKYFFRVVERVQYVVRDPRSLVLLKFTKSARP